MKKKGRLVQIKHWPCGQVRKFKLMAVERKQKKKARTVNAPGPV
jgi:hypothetical protein